MDDFHPQKFGPAMAELIDVDHRSPLGCGSPRIAARSSLAALKVDSAFVDTRVTDDAMARCCLAGLWLHHDFLDESHEFSQNIPSPAGSFWHGIMHRREGDFGNAKYWFRKVGEHPVYKMLPERISAAIKSSQTIDSAVAGRVELDLTVWDPYAFVDACERASEQGGVEESLCRELAWLEWQELFQFCYDRAIR